MVHVIKIPSPNVLHAQTPPATKLEAAKHLGEVQSLDLLESNAGTLLASVDCYGEGTLCRLIGGNSEQPCALASVQHYVTPGPLR